MSTISRRTDTDLSIAFMSWINDELRKEIARREEPTRTALFSARVKGLFVSGLTAVAVGFARLVNG